MDCSTPAFSVLHYLLEFAQTHVHWVGDAIQPSHPLSSPPPAFSLSQHKPFLQWVSSSHQVAKGLGFCCSISPSSEYLELISFKIDWFDLLAVQETLKSFLQHCNSKASVLRSSAFFIVQLSHLYMTTGKTLSLTRWTFVGKVMSLLFDMLSRFVIAFLLRSKHLFNFLAAVTVHSYFGVQENKGAWRFFFRLFLDPEKRNLCSSFLSVSQPLSCLKSSLHWRTWCWVWALTGRPKWSQSTHREMFWS